MINKMINKVLEFIKNSLARKLVLITAAIGIALLILFNIMLPSAFYKMLKSYFTQNMIAVTDGVSKELGFLFNFVTSSNRQIQSEPLNEMIQRYYDQEVDMQEVVVLLPQVDRKMFPDEEAGIVLMESQSIIVVEGQDYFYKDEHKDIAELVLESNWFMQFLTNDYEMEYSPLFTINKKGEEYRFLALATEYQIHDLSCVGILLLSYENIETALNPLLDQNANDYAIVGHENNLLVANLGEDSNINIAEIPEYMFEGNQYQVFEWEGATGLTLVVRTTFVTENIHLIIHFSEKQLLYPYQQVFLLFKVFMAVCFAIFIIILSIVLNRSLKNLKLLSDNMLEVKDGNYDVSIDVSSDDEIGMLSEIFNLMTNQIKDDTDRIKKDSEELIKHEKMKKEMQYIILVSEMNPHFIYNTLNAITYLAEQNRTDDIIKVNYALISTLKDRLKLTNYKSFDTLENEKKVVENYMVIENYLTPNNMLVDFNIPDQDMKQYIPKNILQPLVENAIKHGLLRHKTDEGQIMDGKIDISVSHDSNKITIIISDNGIGMDQETIEKYFSDDPVRVTMDIEHIGIKNIKMRLSSLFSDNYSISATSIKGEKTTIKIIIPAYNEHSEGLGGAASINP